MKLKTMETVSVLLSFHIKNEDKNGYKRKNQTFGTRTVL